MSKDHLDLVLRKHGEYFWVERGMIIKHITIERVFNLTWASFVVEMVKSQSWRKKKEQYDKMLILNTSEKKCIRCFPYSLHCVENFIVHGFQKSDRVDKKTTLTFNNDHKWILDCEKDLGII